MNNNIYENIFNGINCDQLSIKFDWYKFSKHPQVAYICQQIIDEFEIENIQTKNNKNRSREYVKAIVCNMYQAYIQDRCVSIPRDRAFYGDESHFRLQLVKHAPFRSVLDFMTREGYLSEIIGYKTPSGNGYISKYWANSKLYSKFVGFTPEMIESIPNKLILVKDKDKKLVFFKGNLRTKELRKKLETINEQYEKNSFKVILKEQETTIYPRVYAVFNNYGVEKDEFFTEGGRIYSDHHNNIGFQSLPQKSRSTITINGNETVELDYDGLHLSLLYAQVGVQLQGDAYGFLPPKKRKLAKICTLVLLNAKSHDSAIGALEEEFPDEDVKEAVMLCKKFHRRISRFLSSGVGVQLQNRDSAMAVEIVHHFCQLGITILPVHDSFICESVHENVLRDKMDEIYRKLNHGFSCGISKK